MILNLVINLFAMFGQLIPVGGGDPIPLKKAELVIGRKSSCDITLTFANVSGKHCRLTLSAGYWYVEDLDSTNGVKVDGARVRDCRIDPNGMLTIAKQQYRVVYDPVKNGATGAPPARVLREDELLSRSLMEKAGLAKGSARKMDESGSTVPDMPVLGLMQPFPNAQDGPKKDFFADLTFD